EFHPHLKHYLENIQASKRSPINEDYVDVKTGKKINFMMPLNAKRRLAASYARCTGSKDGETLCDNNNDQQNPNVQLYQVCYIGTTRYTTTTYSNISDACII
ncbi:unnamed protein product, partial [Didymodactylos carnosus]